MSISEGGIDGAGRRGSGRASFWGGTLAALLATAAGYAAYRAWGWLFWPDVFSQWIFALVPGAWQAQMVAWLGFDAKILGFYGAAICPGGRAPPEGRQWLCSRQSSGRP